MRTALLLLEGNENYEELKSSTKTFLQIITSDDLYYGLFLLLIMIVAIKLVDLFFYPFRKQRTLTASFIKVCLKALILVTIGMRIIALVPVLKDFASQILMSSSLIVVVLGFVFQEGLTNVVHGFILSVFKPFQIGDRVTLILDGERITGYITEMTARHTVVQNVVNSAHVVIPNSKMDTCTVTNNYFDQKSMSTSFMDIQITYESDVDRAIDILVSTVGSHPLVQEARKEAKLEGPLTAMVRELGPDVVSLRCEVMTKTVEQNFSACSDIRLRLIHAVNADPAVSFAYPHIHLVEDDSGSIPSPSFSTSRRKSE